MTEDEENPTIRFTASPEVSFLWTGVMDTPEHFLTGLNSLKKYVLARHYRLTERQIFELETRK